MHIINILRVCILSSDQDQMINILRVCISSSDQNKLKEYISKKKMDAKYLYTR